MNRPQQGFPPILDTRGPPRVRRFDEQRWLIDNIIRANGIDWDQPRSLYIHLPCGIEANADFAGIRERVKKMADIGPAFAAVAGGGGGGGEGGGGGGGGGRERG
jgi:hypothetical protein